MLCAESSALYCSPGPRPHKPPSVGGRTVSSLRGPTTCMRDVGPSGMGRGRSELRAPCCMEARTANIGATRTRQALASACKLDCERQEAPTLGMSCRLCGILAANVKERELVKQTTRHARFRPREPRAAEWRTDRQATCRSLSLVHTPTRPAPSRWPAQRPLSVTDNSRG